MLSRRVRERQLWLDKNIPPARNKWGGHDFAADYGLQSFVVEIDKEVTAGLDEHKAQAMLRELRPRIEKAARLKHCEVGGSEESAGPGTIRFRITLLADDLDAVRG